jgi:hypothetical protein
MKVRAPLSFSILITWIALALPGVARAQEPVAPAPLAPPPMQAPPAPPAQGISSTGAMPDDKNPGTALGVSLLGTAAGVGLMMAGAKNDSGALGLVGLATVVVGPSFGHFYAGEARRGLTQSAVRAGSFGVMLVGGIWLLGDCFLLSDEPCDAGPGPAVLMAAGLVVGTSAAAYSIYDAPHAARRQNARARRLVLAPGPMAGPDHSSGFGLHLGGQL